MARRSRDGFLTQKDYAKLKGVSPQYINSLVKEGILSLVDGKLIDAARADLELAAIQNPIKAARKAIAEDGALDGADDDENPQSLTEQLLRARILRERETGRIAEIQRRKLEKKLVEASAVETATTKRAANEREALLNWPSRVAPLMASALGVKAEVLRKALDKSIREFLDERSRVTGSDDDDE